MLVPFGVLSIFYQVKLSRIGVIAFEIAFACFGDDIRFVGGLQFIKNRAGRLIKQGRGKPSAEESLISRIGRRCIATIVIWSHIHYVPFGHGFMVGIVGSIEVRQPEHMWELMYKRTNTCMLFTVVGNLVAAGVGIK